MRPNHDRPIERTKIPPCADGCPAGNDVEGFIRLMSEKKIEEALLLLQKTNTRQKPNRRPLFLTGKNELLLSGQALQV
jgi:NADPH-dependent glutamate synthase beta subunit-like oxidoreductase